MDKDRIHSDMIVLDGWSIQLTNLVVEAEVDGGVGVVRGEEERGGR